MPPKNRRHYIWSNPSVRASGAIPEDMNQTQEKNISVHQSALRRISLWRFRL